MFSEEEYNEHLKKISDKMGDDDEALNLLEPLKDDFNERMKQKHYSESDVKDEDGTMWKDKFIEMKQKYKDRFFSSAPVAKEEQEEDVEKDDNGGNVSFEQLFKAREGDYKI